jgi:hypothetical protein
MKNRFLIGFGMALILVTLIASSAEARHCRHHHGHRNWMYWGGNNMYGSGYGNGFYGQGIGNSFYGGPGYGNSFSPGYGYGRRGVLRTILRNVW